MEKKLGGFKQIWPQQIGQTLDGPLVGQIWPQQFFWPQQNDFDSGFFCCETVETLNFA